MTIEFPAFTEDDLLESKTRRNLSIQVLRSRSSSEEEALRAAKRAFFHIWKSLEWMTTAEVADYYQVPENTIRQNYIRCKSEFDADGVKKLTGQELREARDIMSLPSFTSQATLFSPRAVLRMGFILTGSEVAKAVRTATLNLIEGVGKHFSEDLLEGLLEARPCLNGIITPGELPISTPLLIDYWDQVGRGLKSKYKTGAIPDLNKDGIRNQLAGLSAYSKNFRLTSRPEIESRYTDTIPDLVSEKFDFLVDGIPKTAVFIFQICDPLVEVGNIKKAIGDQILKRAKNNYNADYTFMFLVSPFGADPAAKSMIREDLPEEMRGFLGVLTVQEMAELILKDSDLNRKHNLQKGKAIKKQFSAIFNYETPTEPLLFLMS